MKYTTKMFNIITVCFAVFFFIYTGFFVICNSIIKNEIEVNIAKMQEESKKLNAEWLAENQSTGAENENTPAPDAVFKTAGEVISTAVDTIMTAESFDIVVTGNVIANVPSLGMSVSPEVLFNFKLYENGDRYEENLRYLSGMDYGQKMGIKQIRKANGFEYINKTTNITKANGKIIGNFSSSFVKTSGLYFAPQYFYEVNDQTILKETYYKKVDLENGETEYHAQIYLKPDVSVIKYCQLMQKQSDVTKAPIFSSIVMTAVVDSYGNPKSLNTIEYYVLEMNLLGGIKAQNKNNLTYQFLSINKPIKTPLPIV